MRRVIAVSAAALLMTVVWTVPGKGFWALPPGTTNAVLSFIGETEVEVVRWWPSRPRDVNVRPLVPHFWDFCLPGQGAIMILLTVPVDLPPVWALADRDYFDPDAHVRRVLPPLVGQVGAGVRRIDDAQVRETMLRSLMPGSLLHEQLKAAVATEVRSMRMYQRYGYATFLFITGGWWGPFPICRTAVRSVPEGYAIPFVR
jgi:hypothetical protein